MGPAPCARRSPTLTIDATGISGVITLTSGQLLVDKSVTINGAGADMLAIDGNMASRVFQIGLGRTGETVTMSDLTIRNAQSNFGGGIFISNAATATIINCTVSGSSAGVDGGIFNDAALLTIANTTISGNIASEGGGTYNNGTLTITNSTFSGNSAQSVSGPQSCRREVLENHCRYLGLAPGFWPLGLPGPANDALVGQGLTNDSAALSHRAN